MTRSNVGVTEPMMGMMTVGALMYHKASVENRPINIGFVESFNVFLFAASFSETSVVARAAVL